MLGWIGPALKILAGLMGLPAIVSQWLAKRAAANQAKRQQRTDDENANLEAQNEALRKAESITRLDSSAVDDKLRRGKF